MKKSILAIILASILTLTMCLASCADKGDNSSSGGTTPTAKTLTDIEVEKMPTKLTYEEGEVLDLTGIKVNAVYSDNTKADVTSKITTNLGTNPLKATNKSFFVIYKETIEGKTITKNKSISITVKAEEIIKPTRTVDFVPSANDLPHNAIKTSTAESVFYTYYDSTSMKSEAYLELNSDATDKTKGTFTFVEMVGHVTGVENYKMGKIIGNYKIDGDKMTLQSRELHLVKNLNDEAADAANSSKWDNATKEVATIVKDGDKITGLNFGKMSGTDTFWGWSKSKAASFLEGLSTSYNLGADEVYMAVVEGHALSANMKSYYVPASVSIRGINEILEAKTYFAGDKLVLPANIVALVTYVVPEGSDSSQTKNFTDCPLASGYTVAVKRGETTVDITSALEVGDKIVITVDGVSGEFDIGVRPAPTAKTLTAIEVTTAPTKTTYRIGEKFDPTGMVVTAKYSTGDADNVTISDLSKLSMTIGEKACGECYLTESTNVAISYTEGESTVKTNQAITVSYVEPWEVAKTSKASKIYVNTAQLVKSTKAGHYAYAAIELYGNDASGDYLVTVRYTKGKWAKGKNQYVVYAGQYTVADGKVTFSDPLKTLVVTSESGGTMFYNKAVKNSSKEADQANAAAVEAKGVVGTFKAANAEAATKEAIVFAFDQTNPETKFFLFDTKEQVVTFELVENNTLTAEMTSAIPTLG